jgi:aspartate kinase
VVGVASETGLVVVTTTPGPLGTLTTLLDRLDARQVGGKQLLFQEWPKIGGSASLVLDLENLHEYAALRRELTEALGERVQFREGVGAVSCIGAGINSTFTNLRRALGVLLEDGVTVLATSTSSFRISFLMDEATVKASVRRLHDALVTEGVPGLAES